MSLSSLLLFAGVSHGDAEPVLAGLAPRLGYGDTPAIRLSQRCGHNNGIATTANYINTGVSP
jgi:hypothetical protein